MKNAMIVMETLAKWERLLNMKNDFVFAEATFDKELFKDAMKHAFDLFCLTKGAERLPVTFTTWPPMSMFLCWIFAD